MYLIKCIEGLPMNKALINGYELHIHTTAGMVKGAKNWVVYISNIVE